MTDNVNSPEELNRFKVNGSFSLHFFVYPRMMVDGNDGREYARPGVELSDVHKCGVCEGIKMNKYWYDALSEFIGAFPYHRCECLVGKEQHKAEVLLKPLGEIGTE